ncbi:hypothetical protein FB451DRAFT_1174530 [Mycena latifolia]|nr:hypothetical protein FB451DRAFT_1174530 [Mycena latifolia]
MYLHNSLQELQLRLLARVGISRSEFHVGHCPPTQAISLAMEAAKYPGFMEEDQRPANFWLDADLEEQDDDASDSDYAPSSAPENSINDWELADIASDAKIG